MCLYVHMFLYVWWEELWGIAERVHATPLKGGCGEVTCYTLKVGCTHLPLKGDSKGWFER